MKSSDNILQKKRRIPSDLADAAIIFCYKKRQKGMTYEEIGSILQLHHSTIVYKIKKYEDFKRFCPKFRKALYRYSERRFLAQYEIFLKEKGNRSIIKKSQRNKNA